MNRNRSLFVSYLMLALVVLGVSACSKTYDSPAQFYQYLSSDIDSKKLEGANIKDWTGRVMRMLDGSAAINTEFGEILVGLQCCFDEESATKGIPEWNSDMEIYLVVPSDSAFLLDQEVSMRNGLYAIWWELDASTASPEKIEQEVQRKFVYVKFSGKVRRALGEKLVVKMTDLTILDSPTEDTTTSSSVAQINLTTSPANEGSTEVLATVFPSSTPTVTATKKPTSTPKSTKTPTPKPSKTPTPKPTKTLTPTPVPTVPANWVLYEADSFHTYYPPSWTFLTEENQIALFELPGFSRATIAVLATSMPGSPGDSSAVKWVEDRFLPIVQESGDTVTILNQGRWPLSVPATYLETEMKERFSDIITHSVYVMMPIDKTHTASVVLFRLNGYLAPGEFEMADSILAYLSQEPPTQDSRVPSVKIGSKSVNVRQGPSTTYNIIGQAAAGSALDIVGRVKSGDWWQVCCINGKRGWIANSVVTTQGNVEGVKIVRSIPTPSPPPKQSQAPAPSNWVLVADSIADYPTNQANRKWWYLWSEGRYNFHWQDMKDNPQECARTPNTHPSYICSDRAGTDASADIALQWKAPQGGKYLIEWEAKPVNGRGVVLFYKHLDQMSSRGRGPTLSNSVIVDNVIDWELFFWVVRSGGAPFETTLHVRVYRSTT